MLPYGVGETANYRLLGFFSLWVVPSAKHELAGHQSVGESPPRAAVRRSKLNSFLLAKQGYPRPTSFPVLYWLARLWASDSSSSFNTVRQRGMSHRSRLSTPPPKQFWFRFHLHYRWYFVKRCVKWLLA